MGGSGVSEVLSAFGANLAGMIEARTGGSLQCATDLSPASFRNAPARTAHGDRFARGNRRCPARFIA
jgi:hypothetical protein